MEYEEISDATLDECFRINQLNVPSVGEKSREDFSNLVQYSDFNLCCLDENVIGFVVCFEDNKETLQYMNKINHKNFNWFSINTKDYLYIDRVAILEKYRNKGIGSRLYKEVALHAVGNGRKLLTAEINVLPEKNSKSFSFHKKSGFSEITQIKHSKDYKVSMQIKDLILVN